MARTTACEECQFQFSDKDEKSYACTAFIAFTGQHLGEVTLRYGSRAMLLFQGVPPAKFMMSSNNNTAADDDSDEDDEDDEDEQSEGDSEPRNGGRKRGRASGPVSRPPPEPVRRSNRMADKRLKSEH